MVYTLSASYPIMLVLAMLWQGKMTIKMKKDVGMTPSQKLLTQEGTGRIESMQQFSAPFPYISVLGGCGRRFHMLSILLRSAFLCQQNRSLPLHTSFNINKLLTLSCHEFLITMLFPSTKQNMPLCMIQK